MAERVWRRALRDPSPARGVLDDLLKNGLLQVMPAHLAGIAIAIEACGREDPLPEPVAPGARILAGERGRQLDPAGARLDVANVLLANGVEMADDAVESGEIPFEDVSRGTVARSTPGSA